MFKLLYPFFWVVCCCLALLPAQSQKFNFDTSLPVTQLTDTTEFTLLNSRLGSRFSCSFVTGDHGIHTGLLGFDSDEFNELLVMVELEEGKFCFQTASPPRGVQYLQNQTLRFGMTSAQLQGETPNGTTVTFTLVSPFTPSSSLEDTINLKIQTAPAFYFLNHVEAPNGQALEGKLMIGFKKMPYNRDRESAQPSFRYGRELQTIYFKDGGVSHYESLLALNSQSDGSMHFKEGGFQGLSVPLAAPSGGAFEHSMIYAGFHPGRVQYDKRYNMELPFYYTHFWNDIDEVIAYAQSQQVRNLARSKDFERILSRSGISPEEKWVVALSFHTDLANAFLLTDADGTARFYELEGRFQHQSTVDVAHETELNAIFAPWRLKIQLHQWLDYVARQEVNLGINLTERGPEVVKEGMSASEYGPFIYHDVGNYPYIAAQTEYNYGPHMAVEENSTYVLLLYWYWKMTGDDAFVQAKLGMVDVLLHSLTNRDTDGSGIADMGHGWSTYDVSDAIKRSPENVYLGVKQLCAYVAAAEMFRNLAIRAENGAAATLQDKAGGVQDGEGAGFLYEKALPNEKLRMKQAERYEEEAEKIQQSLKKAYRKYGYVPVSLDQSFEGWEQKSVVLGEGLMYMGLGGAQSEILDEVAEMLGDTYQQAYAESQTSYGIKLSSGESVTWFSKVMVSDLVAAYWYDITNSTAHFTYEWNKNNPNAYNDGAYDAETDWIGYWYPRGISSLGYLFRERQLKGKAFTESFLEGLGN